MAQVYQEIAFHTIRVHLRSEEKDFETAVSMMEELVDLWYDKISPIRQSNLLMHACFIFMCCNRFERSYECFQKHWALLKYMPEENRVRDGIHDNQAIMQIAYWFFLKHVPDFRDFYAVKSNIEHSSELWNHKKIAMLNFLEHDNAWIASFCGLPFYNHARTIFPSLPIYEKKRSTPQNEIKVFEKDVFTHNVELTGWEQYYYELYVKETKPGTIPDADRLSDILFSYYHFQNNYRRDCDYKARLSQYVDDIFLKVDTLPKEGIVEIGCGAEPYGSRSQHTLIDISEFVCNLLKDKGQECIHSCGAKYLKTTENKFGICLACNVLQYINRSRLNLFLRSCSEKCSYLVACIDLEFDLTTDIFSKLQVQSKPKSFIQSKMSADLWINTIAKYFKTIHHKLEDKVLFVVSSS